MGEQADFSRLPAREAQRVARQTLLPGFGISEQVALRNTRILVIGAGGLGCPLLQQLAAAGVGHITLMDDDVVSLSNLHRQILFGVPDVGRPKAEVARERLLALQPDIHIDARIERFRAENACSSLENIDILIDGSDTFATKFLAADAAEITGTPLLWGSVLRFSGDVALWWSGPGASAPNGGVGLRDLYPTMPAPDSVPDCATAGVLGVTTSVVAGLMATECILFASGMDRTRIGKLLHYEAKDAQLRQFQVAADPSRPRTKTLSAPTPAQHIPATGVADMLADATSAALDVREAAERLLQPLLFDEHRTVLHLPTSQWEKNPTHGHTLLEQLHNQGITNLWVYCASGKRSQAFISKFTSQASTLGIKLRNADGGVNAWKQAKTQNG